MHVGLSQHGGTSKWVVSFGFTFHTIRKGYPPNKTPICSAGLPSDLAALPPSQVELALRLLTRMRSDGVRPEGAHYTPKPRKAKAFFVVFSEENQRKTHLFESSLIGETMLLPGWSNRSMMLNGVWCHGASRVLPLSLSLSLLAKRCWLALRRTKA